MEFFAGHLENARFVHLSARSFFVDALCGETVAFDGEPDVAVVCEECHVLGLGAGGDPESWVVEVPAVGLREAA